MPVIPAAAPPGVFLSWSLSDCGGRAKFVYIFGGLIISYAEATKAILRGQVPSVGVVKVRRLCKRMFGES